jgi:hypothetical protein
VASDDKPIDGAPTSPLTMLVGRRASMPEPGPDGAAPAAQSDMQPEDATVPMLRDRRNPWPAP